MPKKQTDDPQERKIGYEVRLKPGHPSGMYHRAGLTFSASAPTRMDEVPAAVATDPWLIVSEVPSPSMGEG